MTLTQRHAPLTTHPVKTRFRERPGRPVGRIAQMVQDGVAPEKFWYEIERIFDWKGGAFYNMETD